MSAWAIIVAAGRGERSGLAENKVFYKISGRSLLDRCVEAFEASGFFEGIVLVLSKADRERYHSEAPSVKAIVEGGKTRRDSVYNGLCAVPADCEIVAIHDAARPFVTREIIEATLAAARRYGSGVISTPVTDTIKQINPDGAVKSLDRSTLRAVQTPQSFNFNMILNAHERAQAEDIEVTDDAALYEHYYGSLRLVTVEGAERNKKMTTKADFEALSRMPEMRVGQGCDAHRLAQGRKLILCGVDIPHERGLDGHSDADVAVHALMDALLGAIGGGDIGRHFPDSDPKYKGISSMKLLAEVVALLSDGGWRVVNADVTIVAQRPKLLPYIPEMQKNLADALKAEAVNVKATTTERMGFEGEEIGISAQAVCLVSRATIIVNDINIYAIMK